MKPHSGIRSVITWIIAVTTVFVGPTSAQSLPAKLSRPDDKPGATNKPVKGFILMGESNMVGMGDINDDTANAKAALENLAKIYPDYKSDLAADAVVSQAVAGAAPAAKGGNRGDVTRDALPSGSRGGGIGLYFNGVRQYAKLAWPRLTGNDGELTIEFWIRADRSTAAVSGRQAILSLASRGSKGSVFVIQVEGGNGENWLGLWSNGVDARSLAVIPDALLHFVAVSCTKSELRLYVDGALKNTTKLARPLNPKLSDCYIGGFPPKGWYFKGSVGPITIWRGARTAAQVARDMLDFNTVEHPCLTGKETNLIARIPLDEGAGTAFTDVSRKMSGTLKNGGGWNKPIQLAAEPISEGIWFVIQNKADLDTDLDTPARRLALTPDGKGGVRMERVPDKGDYDRFLWRAEVDSSGRFFHLVNKQFGESAALACNREQRPGIASRRSEPGQLWTISVANRADWGVNAYYLQNQVLGSAKQRIACRAGKVVAEREADRDTAQVWVVAPMEVAMGYCLPRNPDATQTPFTRRLDTGLGPSVLGTTTSAEWTFLNAQLVLRNIINAAQHGGDPASVAGLVGWKAITWSEYDDRGGLVTQYPVTKPLWDANQGWGTYPDDRELIMSENILMRKGPDWPCIREFSNLIHEFAHALDDCILRLDATAHFGNEETFPWAVQEWFLAASEIGPHVTRENLSPRERQFLESVFRPSNTWLPPRWIRTQQAETFELGEGQVFGVGDKLHAYYADCCLTIQPDGNVVVVNKDGGFLWGSYQSLNVPLDTVVAAKMSADGSLVFLDAKRKRVWSSPRGGAGARLLVMQPDTNRGDPPGSFLRIIARDGSVAWRSK